MSKINTAFALLDSDFLKRLYEQRNKKLYAKLVSLNWDEEPIAEITGNVESGSINIDGSSCVRRTCSITLVTNAVRIDEINWSLRTKFYVYIGLENTIDDKYEDIIWFPQGMYVISSFSSNFNGQGYTISISGKDKMCLLNGDLGGALFAAHEFSIIYDYAADGTITKTYIPLYEIVREAVHVYAQEPYENIIINDLNACGVELLDYIGDVPLFIFQQRSPGETSYTTQIMFEIQNMSPLMDEFHEQMRRHGGLDYDLPELEFHGQIYKLLRYIKPENANTTAGYRATDLTYPGELTVAVGGTIKEVLDKIVNMLGEFEYFYDIHGRFIFQRKRIYFNTSWNNAVVDEDQTYYTGNAMSSSSVFDFKSGFLIESFQNKPQLNAIKNDYSVWGKMKTIGSSKLPIHLRYAIDHRPIAYYSLTKRKLYRTSGVRIFLPNGSVLYQEGYDWREIIYQMARDNLQSRRYIYALQASLITVNNYYNAKYQYEQDPSPENKEAWDDWQQNVKFHQDYNYISANYYNEYYRYDINKKKFVKLKSLEEFNKCKTSNEYLFSNNPYSMPVQLTQADIEYMSDELGYDYLLAEENGLNKTIETGRITAEIQHQNYVARQSRLKTSTQFDALNSYTDKELMLLRRVANGLVTSAKKPTTIVDKKLIEHGCWLDPYYPEEEKFYEIPENSIPINENLKNYCESNRFRSLVSIGLSYYGTLEDDEERRAMLRELLPNLNPSKIEEYIPTVIISSWSDEDRFTILHAMFPDLTDEELEDFIAEKEAAWIPQIEEQYEEWAQVGEITREDVAIGTYNWLKRLWAIHCYIWCMEQLEAIFEVDNRGLGIELGSLSYFKDWDNIGTPEQTQIVFLRGYAKTLQQQSELATTLYEDMRDTIIQRLHYMNSFLYPLPSEPAWQDIILYSQFRDTDKELRLLQDIRNHHYIERVQSELDAWQDTFRTGYDAYYADLLAYWPQLYRTEQKVNATYNSDGTVNVDDTGNIVQAEDVVENYEDWVANGYWNPDYVSYSINGYGVETIRFVHPESLFFWLDFCDIDSETSDLYEYSVSAVGRRAKAVNDEDVKSIYVRETPTILFEHEEWPTVYNQDNLGYTRIQINDNIRPYFRISSQGKSAKDVLDTLVYEGTYFNNSITFSSIPVYTIEPNTRITVQDSRSGIDGEFLVKSISMQLQHDGFMSVNATKAVNRII